MTALNNIYYSWVEESVIYYHRDDTGKVVSVSKILIEK